MSFLKDCQRYLIDLTARNRLVNFLFNKTCLDIEKIKENLNKAQNSFEVVRIDDYDDEELTAQEKLQKEIFKTLKKIYNKQQEVINEKGFNPTNWAYYFFRYKDNDKEKYAPVYLISSEVKRDGAGGFCIDHFSSCNQEVQFNYAIYEKFKKDFNIDLKIGFIDFEDSFSIELLDNKIDEIRDFLNKNGNIHKISIEKREVLAVFNSAKASLYNELTKFEDKFVNHNLIKTFLSKENNELNQSELALDAREIDKLSSYEFFSPLDFDSSQLQAIKAAKDGKNFIIQGPPGTGKTQTISNIIAELTTQGKKVLFVAEKKAAIDAVLKNFREINLEKLFLDLHDKKTKSRNIVDKIIDSIEFFQCKNIKNINEANFFEQLNFYKNKLNKRTEVLHKKLEIGKTPFELVFELMKLKDVRNLDCDFFTKINKEDFEKILEILDKIKNYAHIYYDESNPYLKKNIDNLKSFLQQKNEGHCYLSIYKNLSNELTSVILSRDSKERMQFEIINSVKKYSLNLEEFNSFDDIKIFFNKYQEFLRCKILLNGFWSKFEIQNNHKDTLDLLNKLRNLLEKFDNEAKKINNFKEYFQNKKNELNNFNFMQKNDLQDLQTLGLKLDEIKKYKNICNDKFWALSKFKDNAMGQDDFIENLIKIFDLLAKELRKKLTLESDLEALNIDIFNSKNSLKNLIGFSFFKERKRIKINKKIEESSAFLLEIKRFVLDKIEFQENIDLNRVAFVEKAVNFFTENKFEIAAFKSLQNSLCNLGFEDVFLSYVNEDDYINHLIKLISIDKEINELKRSLEILEKSINENKKDLSNSLILTDKVNFEFGEMVKNINIFLPTIDAKNLKLEIDELAKSLCIESFWQFLMNFDEDINIVKDLILKYAENKQDLIAINKMEMEIKNNLNRIINSPSNFLDIKTDSAQQEVDLYLRFLPKVGSVIEYLTLKESLENLTINDFWDKFIKEKLPPQEVLNIFKKSFYLKVLENLKLEDELICDIAKTNQYIVDFKDFDKKSIKLNRDRIIKRIGSQNKKQVDYYEFLDLKNRKRFGKPRKIISKYRDLILNSIGCVVCSPLTICEYFEIDEELNEPIFDVVIFDEASQIFTWDALSAIFRAKQLIIAGDSEQMPPSNLFAASDEEDEDCENEDEEKEKVSDFDSLLSFSENKFRQLQLQWHYRSKFEELIHPSNKFVYKGRLITFPNADKNEKPIDFHYLPDGLWSKQKNDVEAKFTIKLLKKIYESGVRSVGVIAINQKQQTLIKDLLDKDDKLRVWYESESEDGLFVKNLENCQGDERDVIIICTSYAKNNDGRIDGRMFSQLNKENSYKRLNVMFSRAKKKVHFLSSLEDIPTHLVEGKKGMEFFKKYFEFAKTEKFGNSANENKNYDDFDSGFEESVCKSLRILGYEVHSQVGCSGYKIDLAVVCPKSRNYILGIECDGEMYHSGKTARERDRLRQELLESKGWKIHRIWSYDWIHSKNEELEKLKDKIEKLLT
jgi:superfamily I DNA and/or RNA helicase/signal recognition particle GTPase